MINFETILLTVEMKSLGATANEASSMWRLLSNPHFNKTCNPRIIIPKDKIYEYIGVKTLRTAKARLKNLDKNNFIELKEGKEEFEVNIMPYLLKLEELQKLQNIRMKDVKHPFPDQYG